MDNLINSVKIISIKYLNGPNIWSKRKKCMEVLINIGEFENYPSNKLNNFYENLIETFSTMKHHECGMGQKEGFFTRVKNGTYFGHILEHIVLEIQSFSGFHGGFGRTRETEYRGIYKLVIGMGFDSQKLITECFYSGLEILFLIIQNKKINLYQYYEKIKKITYENVIGKNVYEIIKELPINIPYIIINNQYDLIQLGYGIKQRKIWLSVSNLTSGISESIIKDKYFTKKILHEQNISIPNGDIASNITDVYKIVDKIGYPVVIKPINANQQKGITLNITSKNKLKFAFEHAIKFNKNNEKNIIIEKYFDGDSYRIVIVNNKIIACCKSHFKEVNTIIIGDGISSINDLINYQVPNKYLELYYEEIEKKNNNTIVNPISMEEQGNRYFKKDLFIEYLNKQNLNLTTVLSKGQKLKIKKIYDSYIDIDINNINNDIKDKCLLATKIVDIDICGIDLILKDIEKPLNSDNGVILELNSGPDLHIHKNSKISIGKEIIKYIYNNNDIDSINGYIPILGISGNGNLSFVNKFISSFFIKIKKYCGSYGINGYFLNNKKINIQNEFHWQYVNQILINTNVEVAIFDNNSKQILDEGVFYTKCNSIILGNINTELHDDNIQNKEYECLINEPENSLKILRVTVDIVREDGYAILNADDPNIKDLDELCNGKIIYYTQNNNINNHQYLRNHVLNKGKIVMLKNSFVCLYQNYEIIQLFKINENMENNIPIRDILAAVGGIWSYIDIFNNNYSNIFEEIIDSK
jgi:cyanophycin synthetase